jgi:hypothetical protein
MDVLKNIPGWAWVLIIFFTLVMVYGFFNRRWVADEEREKAREAKSKEISAPDSPHEPVRAASLHVPPGADGPDAGSLPDPPVDPKD